MWLIGQRRSLRIHAGITRGFSREAKWQAVTLSEMSERFAAGRSSCA
jgi:hypothetical protein